MKYFLQAFVALLIMTGAAWAQCVDTSATPDLKVTQGTGSGCVISTVTPIIDQSTKGGPIPASAAGYQVKLGNFPYTIAQAGSTGFPVGNVFLANVSKTAGIATITTTVSVFEGATSSGAISLRPGDWVALTVDGGNYLALGGRYEVVLTADKTTSTAPNGLALTTVDGTWTWGPAVAGRPGEYQVYLNGAGAPPANPGVASLMEVANGGKLYVQTISYGWFLWTAGTWASTAAPGP